MSQKISESQLKTWANDEYAEFSDQDEDLMLYQKEYIPHLLKLLHDSKSVKTAYIKRIIENYIQRLFWPEPPHIDGGDIHSLKEVLETQEHTIEVQALQGYFNFLYNYVQSLPRTKKLTRNEAFSIGLHLLCFPSLQVDKEYVKNVFTCSISKNVKYWIIKGDRKEVSIHIENGLYKIELSY